MQKSLLAHIAGGFITQYENVANSGICYLLNEYAAARHALQGFLGIDAAPSRYVTEEANAGGRFDVAGKDADGNAVVIIEGKFWANLTENQPENYLEALTAAGKLLFLAPGKRAHSLQLELTKRLGGADARLQVRSWNDFLAAIERANNRNHDAQLASDVTQLKALCQKMDVEGMPPLSRLDLDPMNGRVAAQFADVIDECHGVIRTWEEADFSGFKKTSVKYGHGFFFSMHGFFGCRLFFSSRNWHMRENHTPIWLGVRKCNPDRSFSRSEAIEHALHSLDPANAYNQQLGIILQPGMDKERVVAHIAGEVKRVLGALNESARG